MIYAIKTRHLPYGDSYGALITLKKEKCCSNQCGESERCKLLSVTVCLHRRCFSCVFSVICLTHFWHGRYAPISINKIVYKGCVLAWVSLLLYAQNYNLPFGCCCFVHLKSKSSFMHITTVIVYWPQTTAKTLNTVLEHVLCRYRWRSDAAAAAAALLTHCFCYAACADIMLEGQQKHFHWPGSAAGGGWFCAAAVEAAAVVLQSGWKQK